MEQTVDAARSYWAGLPASARVGAGVLSFVLGLSLAARWRWSPERAVAKMVQDVAVQLVHDAVALRRRAEKSKRALIYSTRADAYVGAALRLVPSASELARLARVPESQLTPPK
jgi:hypothetical protein